MKLNENARWTIGISIAIVIAIISFYYSFYQSQKNLTYRVISYHTTNYKEGKIADGLKIIFKDKEVENLHSLILEFTNSGYSPIRSSDFESDLWISFGNNTKVLHADLINSTPQNMPIKIDYSDSVITIEPTLLNSNDRFILQAYITGVPSIPTINGRIAGIDRITEIINQKVEYRRTKSVIWLDGIGGLLLIILGASVISFLFLGIDNSPFFNKVEIIFWFAILFNGGSGLIAYWGENINFMLPRWMNFVLMGTVFPAIVWVFYKFRAHLKNK